MLRSIWDLNIDGVNKGVTMSKKRENANGLTKHHTICSSRSRCNTDTSIVLLPLSFHRTFHRLFENMLPDEIHLFLDFIMEPGTSWTNQRIRDLIQCIKEDTDNFDEEEEN